ncbi:SDR family oxidoreductase [Ahrensia kielensis]|uniref:SDR family oxidoreductase n=1 Tax=Ahrensia kielensis TaxID=76980 RepID=A0ABU9T1W3_9HYPH
MRRKILITGGSSGIGLALANRLSARHDVMVTGSRDCSEITEVFSPNLIYVQASQSDPEAAVKIIAEALLKAGWVKLDNVVLNAGTGFAVKNAIDDVERVRQTIDINLTATILLSRTLYPWLAKAEGTLTIVGSVAHKGQTLFPVYAASKGALHGFVRALRSEWRGRVAVQILHPGPTKTDMHAKAGHDAGRLRSVFIRPSSMAAMMEYAMSSKRSPLSLSFLKYYLGGSIMGKRL